MSLKPINSISLVEAVSRPGSAERANEDTFGRNEICAFVIDGATGLSDINQFDAYGSDAAWLAQNTRDHLQQHLESETQLNTFIRDLINQLRDTYFANVSESEVPRYAWPSASFALLHVQQNRLFFAGLGDCTLYIQDERQVQTINPLTGFASTESKAAAHHLQTSGGFDQKKNLLGDPETLQTLREMRSLQNTEAGGIWTLGLVPEASDHLHIKELDVGSSGSALLCSDGFSALVTDYDQYTAQSLLEAANDRGLDVLMNELRHIETVSDPNGKKFPRFKQSDDATAVLVSWSE